MAKTFNYNAFFEVLSNVREFTTLQNIRRQYENIVNDSIADSTFKNKIEKLDSDCLEIITNDRIKLYKVSDCSILKDFVENEKRKQEEEKVSKEERTFQKFLNGENAYVSPRGSSYAIKRLKEYRNGICESCNQNMTKTVNGEKTYILDVHHIKEVEYGGYFTLNNLLVLCPNCHATIHRTKINSENKEEIISILNS